MALFDKLFGTTESAPAKTEREEKLQKLTEKICKKIDEISDNKTKEIMSV